MFKSVISVRKKYLQGIIIILVSCFAFSHDFNSHPSALTNQNSEISSALNSQKDANIISSTESIDSDYNSQIAHNTIRVSTLNEVINQNIIYSDIIENESTDILDISYETASDSDNNLDNDSESLNNNTIGKLIPLNPY